MDGPETFREIRSDDPEANVVIITAYPDSVAMTEALQIGPFAVMKKPFILEELRFVTGNASKAAGYGNSPANAP